MNNSIIALLNTNYIKFRKTINPASTDGSMIALVITLYCKHTSTVPYHLSIIPIENSILGTYLVLRKSPGCLQPVTGVEASSSMQWQGCSMRLTLG